MKASAKAARSESRISWLRCGRPSGDGTSPWWASGVRERAARTSVPCGTPPRGWTLGAHPPHGRRCPGVGGKVRFGPVKPSHEHGRRSGGGRRVSGKPRVLSGHGSVALWRRHVATVEGVDQRAYPRATGSGRPPRQGSKVLGGRCLHLGLWGVGEGVIGAVGHEHDADLGAVGSEIVGPPRRLLPPRQRTDVAVTDGLLLAEGAARRRRCRLADALGARALPLGGAGGLRHAPAAATWARRSEASARAASTALWGSKPSRWRSSTRRADASAWTSLWRSVTGSADAGGAVAAAARSACASATSSCAVLMADDVSTATTATDWPSRTSSWGGSDGLCAKVTRRTWLRAMSCGLISKPSRT